ncbi:MAG: hypothetical protein H8E47_11775 [Anaerolineales bacterium]|nr:hypothetical protein [Anaerolineales bacterium]
MPQTTSPIKLDNTPRTNTQRLLYYAAEEMTYIPSAEWARWVAYFLEALGGQTLPEDFNEVLFQVQTHLSRRMCHGEW